MTSPGGKVEESRQNLGFGFPAAGEARRAGIRAEELQVSGGKEEKDRWKR